VSDCPQCGLPPESTTQDDNTGEELFMDEAGHVWPADGSK
jgi:hypothetical protein